jgi:fused signal recognition particle receptor
MDPQLADMAHSIHVESLRAAATERVPVVSQAPPVEPAPDAAAAPERQPEAEIADVFFAPERSTEPEPELSLAPEPASSLAPEPRPLPSMVPEPGPASNASAPHDVFASFAPASSAHVPAQDLSFDLSSAFSIQQPTRSREEAPIDFSMPPAAVEPVSDPVVERDADSYGEPASEAWLEPEAVVQPEPLLQPEPVEPEPAFEAELLLHPEPAPQAEPVLQPAPGFEVDAAFEPEPEPMTEAGPDPEALATLARLERFLDAIQSLRA